MNVYLKWLLPWIRAYDKFGNFDECEEFFNQFLKEKIEKELVEEKRKIIVFKD